MMIIYGMPDDTVMIIVGELDDGALWYKQTEFFKIKPPETHNFVTSEVPNEES